MHKRLLCRMHFEAGWLVKEGGTRGIARGACSVHISQTWLFQSLAFVISFVILSKEMRSTVVDGVGGYEVHRCLYVFCLAFSWCFSLLPSSRSDI